MKRLMQIGLLLVGFHAAACSYDKVVFPAGEGADTKGNASLGDASAAAVAAAGSTFPVASEAINGVATRLHALIDPSGKKNYIVSPFSVAVIVGQLLLGARGETQKRLRTLLSPSKVPRGRADVADVELHRQLGGLLQSLQDPAYAAGESSEALLQLQADTALFHSMDVRLNAQFVNDTKKYYHSEIKALDFRGNSAGSQRYINDWVSRKTGGVFDAVLPVPPPKSTSALIVNTLYFKAAWLTPFDPELTITAPFHLNGTHLIDVNYMRGQFEVPFADSNELRCRMVVLPYKQKDVNMYLILPHRHHEAEIKDFAESLTSAAISSLVNAATENSVTVVLPRMSLKTKFRLKEPIVNFRPAEDLGSRLGDADDADPSAWKFLRPSTTPSGNKTRQTTPRTPTTPRPRKTTTPARPTRPVASQEQTQEEEEEDTTAKAPKRPSQQRPTTGRYPATASTGRPSTSTSRPPPTTTPKRQSASNADGGAFRFDMSGASSDQNFNIEDIVHQISLEVNELGTEAAAVTVTDVNYSGDIRVVKMDRPFVFFIRHEPSLSNLFWGVITDPTNGDYD